MNKTDWCFINWETYKELLKNYFGFLPNSIDEYYKKSNGDCIKTEWLPIKNWEERSDFDLLNLLIKLRPFDGELIVYKSQ